MNQTGIDGAVKDSIEMLTPDLHSLLYSTVVCVGGHANIPNYTERVHSAVRRNAPGDFEVYVPKALQSADESVWRGGVRLAASGKLDQIWVTKQEYEEKGGLLCRQKMKEVEDCLSSKGRKSNTNNNSASGKKA
eukprot:CAMPEP_0173467432 /NCGR_PEP_ID=MMETSP1357-20121228/75046_1 /TAXON_ID=77926 /ORGANISM="Hemiselmis rufescens, Strain PCC563" /LENGTH=133 /DNA_ID=CAMNT_0014435565 /DNA_START=30 /DNA_END=431 /DNA_ORIENTATION=+